MGAGWSKLSPAEIDVFDEHEPSGKQTLPGMIDWLTISCLLPHEPLDLDTC